MAPYKADGSTSPQERQHSPSPDPITAAAAAAADLRKIKIVPAHAIRNSTDDGAGPSKRAKLTEMDFQRIHIEKLLANPDKEVALPEPVRDKTLRAPHEMMKNVQGSAAGAGSGEFHVYKASRRREYERVKLMEDKGRALEEQEAFQARQEARDAQADAKTAKNRAKRQKRKGGGKKGDETTEQKAAQGGVKRKLAGGAEGFNAPRAGAAGSDNGDDNEEKGREEIKDVGVGNLNVPIPPEGGALASTISGSGASEERRVIEEPRVVIHDDD